MKKIATRLIIALTLTLGGCSAVPMAAVVPVREDLESLPDDFSLFELGRALSDGQVDLYDPWLSVYEVIPPDRGPNDSLAAFAPHPNMLVSDPGVLVYSLESAEEQPEIEIVIEGLDDPVALSDKGQLPP